MVTSLLVRGLLVGLAAGLVAFAFAFVFAEPQVQRAIEFEDRLAALRQEPAGAEPISRGVQRTVGLLVGTTVYGVALGGLFALLFAWAYGRVVTSSPRLAALTLAAVAFVSLKLVPFTKYPANPPAVGNPETLDQRTVAFALMVAISVSAVVAGSRTRRALRPRLGEWNATLAGVALFVVIITVSELVLPTIDEIPAGFPADVLYRFRLASLGVDLVLWTTIALCFGALAHRLVDGAKGPPPGTAAGLSQGSTSVTTRGR